MISPDSSIEFACGARMKNRFMLAPLTNTQSHEDGHLSEEEFNWLTLRAKGQFGLVMTCASHVQEIGKGFKGQLGIFSDELIKDHQRLASKIKSYGSLAVIQLHHAGLRSPADLIGEAPVSSSESIKHGARALSIEEIGKLRDDFINAAVRAKKAGYDGVEIHGAHGYILTQFISSTINKRTDQYGGSLENRSRLLFEIVEGVRAVCGKNFLLGIRISPERFGMQLNEIKEICQRLIDQGNIDFLDVSLWDSFKLPEEESFRNMSLLEHFTNLDFKKVMLTVAGKIQDANDVARILNAGVDFVAIGRSGILHHDFPIQVIEDPNFKPTEIPVSEGYLRQQGLGTDFISYLKRWPGFIK